ncbi:ornithine cyclodeaminase family protein [Anaerofilum sp. BX8]|uniref:Ornithine cyclodeaminase family protein n=1 Tax=Anaerofilum hominis TaxID=2763016 RepID=A0A923ICD9_9FIRM|nr:ornithine cyclodeaminase family protein [Anaerofilum hominis]MBC5580320.1 ornithine cyclodeaminase family protein [Anaerofilum hominis]
MKTRIIRGDEVRRLLTMEDCIEAMRAALRDVSAGDGAMLQRCMLPLPQDNKFALMGGADRRERLCGAKVIVFPGAEAARRGTSQGIIPLFDSETGALAAIVDAEQITAVRTAAASAAATDLLARKSAASLAILGAGRIGSLHIDAIRRVRPIRTVYVWNRTFSRAQECCRRAAELGLRAVPCASAEEAVREADIVCTVTQAREPILLGRWLKPGAHINAVGACSPLARELDSEAVLRSRIYADQREAALRDSGDLAIPLKEGSLDARKICGEVGQVLLGELPGRQSEEEITLFESVGISLEDLCAAALVRRKAEASGLGLEVEF